MSTEQCRTIDKHLKKQVLGKRGVVRTAPDIVAFSPKKSGGIGLHRTEVDQTIDQAKMILHHGHKGEQLQVFSSGIRRSKWL